MKQARREHAIYFPLLFFVTVSGLSISRLSTVILQGTGRNSVWFVSFVLLVILVGTWLSLRVSIRYGGVSIMQASGEACWKWLVPIVSMLYALLFWSVAAYYIVAMVDYYSRTLLPGSPVSLVLATTLIIVLAALFPIETHGRYAHALILFNLPVFLIVMGTPLMHVKWDWLWPVVHMSEMVRPLDAAAATVFLFSPLAAITMIRPPDRTFSFRSFSLIMLSVALYTSYVLGIGIATLGIETATMSYNIAYYTLNSVRVENFVIERVIFLATLLWIYYGLGGSAFMLRCSAYAFAQGLRMRLHPLVVIALGGIAGIVIWRTESSHHQLSIAIWLGYFSFALLVLLPAALYGISLLRKKQS